MRLLLSGDFKIARELLKRKVEGREALRGVGLNDLGTGDVFSERTNYADVMTRKDFTERIEFLVREYLNDPKQFGPNYQIKVNPSSLMVTLADNTDMLDSIEYSNEAVEEAAGADTGAYEDAMDSQARQNPDFYPVSRFFRHVGENHVVPNTDAIEAVADEYFK